MRRTWQHVKQQKGFTIVELLIVVVVIAVLAGIAIVSYSSVRQQAVASQAGAAASQYRRILMTYLNDNSQYPVVPTANYYYACLGTGYIVRDSSGREACRWVNSPRYVQPDFNTALASLSRYQMNMSGYAPSTLSDGTVIQGMSFVFVRKNMSNAFVVDGTVREYLIEYVVPFDNGCTETLQREVSTGPYYRLITNSNTKESGYNYSDGFSICYLLLPDGPS
jgi:prepilin-type N-terminal cleavage/methylation domain-containing protein